MTMDGCNSDEDIFHSVTMTEEISWKQGYSAGQEEGQRRAYEDGHHLGAQKGTEIGREVGFYAGYAAYVLKTHHSDKSKARVLKVCDGILQLTNSFSSIDPVDELLTENLKKIQAKFKQLTSLLGVQVEYTTGQEAKGSSF